MRARARRVFISSFWAAIVFILALSAPSFALEVKRETLKNGLTLIHVERHNLPLVMATLLVKASPIDEPEDLAGLSNLTASLLDEGTKTRTSNQISEEIEFIGASIGQGTDYDYTTVSLSVLKKDVGKGFEIFADIVLNPTFPDEEITRKRDLIKGSLKQGEESPNFLASRAFRKAVFGVHPYGRLVDGSVETLDRIKRDDLSGFHAGYYVPNNSVLVVVGDITPDELKGLIKKYLGGWKKKEVSRTILPEAGKPKGAEVIKIDKALTQATINLGGAGVKRDNPDYYAISVMNYILGGGGFSSRLMQKVRDEMGLAYDVHSYFTSNKERGLFMVGVQTKNESANIVIETIIAEIKRLKEGGVAPSELEDAKAYLTGSFAGRIDTMRKIADFLALVEFYGLGTDYMDKYPGYINSVTAEDVKKAAIKYIDLENYALVIVADQKKADVKGR